MNSYDHRYRSVIADILGAGSRRTREGWQLVCQLGEAVDKLRQEEFATLQEDKTRMDWLESAPVVPFDGSPQEGIEPEFSRARVTRKVIDAARLAEKNATLD